MLLNFKKSQFILTLIFTPIYFTTSGIFIAEVGESGLHLGKTGLVFPAVFFCSIIYLGFGLFNTFKYKRINRDVTENGIVIIFSIIGFFLILLTLIGIIFSGDTGGAIKLAQFLTGGLGIVISFYLFSLKKVSSVNFFGNLALFFTILIIIHFGTSIVIFGYNPLSGSVYPSILGFGIYQSRVYYPYLVTLIFFSGYPYLLQKFKKYTFVIYSLFLFYVFTLQVRGALIAFLLSSILIALFTLRTKAKYFAILVSLVFFYFTSKFIKNTEALGRIGEVEKLKDFNGRTNMWLEIINNLNIKNLFVGSFFNDKDHISAHNQYFEFLTLSGIFPLILLLFVGLLALKMFKDSYKYSDRALRIFSLIIISNLIVDLNVNVPLTNTNPAIHYWFIWSGFYFYYIQVKKRAGINYDI